MIKRNASHDFKERVVKWSVVTTSAVLLTVGSGACWRADESRDLPSNRTQEREISVEEEGDDSVVKLSAETASRELPVLGSGVGGAGEPRTFSGMSFVWVPPGEFLMGSPGKELDRDDDERQHGVTLTEGFWLGKYEVTKAEWRRVMGTQPWRGEAFVLNDDRSPAVYLRWIDAVEFCRRLTEQGEGTYRLPTEAEWEYACRAGSTTRFSFGEDDADLGSYAWYDANAWNVDEKYAHVVGLKAPNRWDLYDMHGNVWEWCSDWFGDYPNGSSQNPVGANAGLLRVLRGGPFDGYSWGCRSADRNWFRPSDSYSSTGFRVVRAGVD